jgi:predicted dehydrogenase
MLKVAVVGLGTMGAAHLDAWRSVPDARVVAVCSRDPAKGEAFAARCGARAFTSFEDMYEQVAFDVADLCLPTDLHPAFIRKAAAAGKHIVCEKPLALTPEEAEACIRYCEQRNVRLFVGHDLRFCPEYRQARERIAAGELGRVGIVRMSRRSRYPYGTDDWYADTARSGGMIMDLLIHDLDWLLWTFGPAARVTALAVARRTAAGPLEYALIAVRFRSGVIAHVEGSWAHADFRSSLEVSGTKGMLVEDIADSAPLTVVKRGEAQAAAGVVVPEMTLNRNSYELELMHFADCLRNGTSPLITPQDALRAVELARAAMVSVETGRPVMLESGGAA